jgi:hypothetical protein
MQTVCACPFTNFSKAKRTKHNLVTKKKLHWAILSIHMDTTCGLTHVNQKKNLDLIIFPCTYIMSAFGVLNTTHNHVRELPLGVQAFHFLKCSPSFIEISPDAWWEHTGSHKKNNLNKNVNQVFTFSKSP